MNENKNTHWIFDPDVACIVGVEEAIMYNNIKFWCDRNEKKKSVMHFHQNKYWTFNSMTKFCETFPFWSHDQIKRIVRNLIKEGFIIKGQFNRFRYDKTSWYTYTDIALKSDETLGMV
jgi:hypothetical protein